MITRWANSGPRVRSGETAGEVTHLCRRRTKELSRGRPQAFQERLQTAPCAIGPAPQHARCLSMRLDRGYDTRLCARIARTKARLHCGAACGLGRTRYCRFTGQIPAIQTRFSQYPPRRASKYLPDGSMHGVMAGHRRSRAGKVLWQEFEGIRTSEESQYRSRFEERCPGLIGVRSQTNFQGAVSQNTSRGRDTSGT